MAFNWTGFIDAVAAWIESFEDFDFDGNVNMAVYSTPLDMNALDSLVTTPTLLTLYDESGNVEQMQSRNFRQIREVRIVRRGPDAAAAVEEAGNLYSLMLNRRRFDRVSGFTATIARSVRAPSLITRNQDGSAHAEFALEFMAYSV